MIKNYLCFQVLMLSFAIFITSFSAVFAGMSDFTISISHQQPVYAPKKISGSQLPPQSFCDPIEISIALAQNAFESDYKPNSGEIIKVKKPVRWSLVKEYSNLPSDFLLEYENYVEVAFSIYSSTGKLIEDIAGVYQVDASTQELVTNNKILLKRLLSLYQSDATLPVYECLSFQLANNSIKRAKRDHDFSIIFEYADFIELRCNNLNYTSLYSADDLYAYYSFLNNLNQGLNLFMFQLRSGKLETHAVLRQCNNAITRLNEVKDLLAETLDIR